ncbi:MAG TPA: hypothetical protein VFF30_19010 [Nitrososphaerales archaeon]|nr:hypothetical protein [Nitrososphaerales archaeon]
MPSRISRRLVAVIVIVVLIVAGLAVWTIRAPTTLTVQSEDQLKNSVMAFSRSFSNLSISDSAGSYTFRFGFDYPNNSISRGSATVFKVYAALTSQQLSSSFARGISLDVQSATLLVDGKEDASVKVVTTAQPTLEVIQFEFVNTSLPAGTYNTTARLVLSTMDVYYVGYFTGTTSIVTMDGSFTIS